MNYLATFLAGLAIGAAVVWYGVDNITENVKEGAVTLAQEASEQRYDHCSAKFLSRTQCYQKEKAKVCEEKILAECGENPAVVGQKEVQQ